MNSLKPILLFFLFTYTLFGVTACNSETNVFKSTSGRYTVKFEELKHFKSKGTGDIDDVSYMLHKISFFNSEDSLIAETEYADVYGWDENAEPFPPLFIFEKIIWSPKEDFVILPEEEWAGAPGTPKLEVINLNPEMEWSKFYLYMYIKYWADDFRLFGNIADDCHHQVEMFDGRIGKSIVVMKAESPIGYEIVKVNGHKLIIKKLLDNCRSDEDQLNFIPECYELDVTTRRLTEAVCED